MVRGRHPYQPKQAPVTDPGPLTTPEREALLSPYKGDLQRSEVRRMMTAIEPKTPSGFVRWARWAYAQEPPMRLHVHDIGEDGTPRWSGDFWAWIRGSESQAVACAPDDDGYYRTPFRCALLTFHGRFDNTERAEMAELVLDIAANETFSPEVIAARHGITGPQWVMDLVVTEIMRRAWGYFAQTPRQERGEDGSA